MGLSAVFFFWWSGEHLTGDGFCSDARGGAVQIPGILKFWDCELDMVEA